jgi:ABC-type nitrate/sulfonate/bicarbonate transport system permease component
LGLVALAHRGSVDYVAGIVELLRPIPPIAWTPVAILVFGIGSPPAVAVVALSAFFPLWLSLLHGIDSVDRRYVMAARSLGAGRLLTFRFVLLPMILPGFVQGLRLAVGMGWFSVIAAEMIGASTGLGQAIRKSALNLNMEQTYGYLLVIGLIGLLSSWSVARLTGAGGKGP